MTKFGKQLMAQLDERKLREIAINEVGRRLDQAVSDEVALTRATQIIDGLLGLPLHAKAAVKPELLALLDKHYNFIRGEADRGRAFAAAAGIKRAVAKPKRAKTRGSMCK